MSDEKHKLGKAKRRSPDSAQTPDKTNSEARSKTRHTSPARLTYCLLNNLTLALSCSATLRMIASGQMQLPRRDGDHEEGDRWSSTLRSKLHGRIFSDLKACEKALFSIEVAPGQLKEKILDVKHEVGRTLDRIDRFALTLHQDGPLDEQNIQKFVKIRDELEEGLVLVSNLIKQRDPQQEDKSGTTHHADNPDEEIEPSTQEEPNPLPSRDALRDFTSYYLEGKKQASIAATRYGNANQQYKVSRHIKAVKEYLDKGGSLNTALSQQVAPSKTLSLDPSFLDMGKRVDGLTPRQRERPDQD